MTIFTHARQSLQRYFYPRVPEWIAAGTCASLGLVLLSDPEMMASAPATYHNMLRLADQGAWAAAFLTTGVLRMIILVINGAWRRSPHLRALSAILSCFLWTQTAFSFSAAYGIGFALSMGFLAMELINIVRASQDARTIDDAFYGLKQRGQK